MDEHDPFLSLEAEGFEGFLTVGQLHRDGCAGVPDAPGVYVVRSRDAAPHAFAPRSSAPPWRRRDPTVTPPELAEHWVAGASLLYVGCARGPGVRSRLRQRIKRYLRFGHGKVVGHWGGRFVWQLLETSRLQVAWRVCADGGAAAALEAELLGRFEKHYGALPFANLPDDRADEDETARD